MKVGSGVNSPQRGSRGCLLDASGAHLVSSQLNPLNTLQSGCFPLPEAELLLLSQGQASAGCAPKASESLVTALLAVGDHNHPLPGFSPRHALSFPSSEKT